MTYARIENGAIAEYPVYEGDIRLRFPECAFGRGEYFTPPDGYEPVLDVARPSYDPMTQDIAEDPPSFANGHWSRVWAVSNAGPDVVAERLAAKRASMTVTMRQARLALLGAGKLAAVDAALASLPSPMKEAAQIEWEYAADVRRVAPLIAQLGPALGLSEAALDALFEAAAVL